MRSYESPKTYLIWDSPIGCVTQDVTHWYFGWLEKLNQEQAK